MSHIHVCRKLSCLDGVLQRLVTCCDDGFAHVFVWELFTPKSSVFLVGFTLECLMICGDGWMILPATTNSGAHSWQALICVDTSPKSAPWLAIPKHFLQASPHASSQFLRKLPKKNPKHGERVCSNPSGSCRIIPVCHCFVVFWAVSSASYQWDTLW